MPFPKSIFIPANTLTLEQMADFLEAYTQSPEIMASVKHMYEVMSRPGITFTEEQKALIRRIVLDRLREEFAEAP